MSMSPIAMPMTVNRTKIAREAFIAYALVNLSLWRGLCSLGRLSARDSRQAVRYADVNNFWQKMSNFEDDAWRRNVGTAGALGGVAAGTAGVMGYFDSQDISSDENVSQQHLDALNAMYADGDIDEEQYEAMLAGSFAAAERSDQFSTAL